MVSGEWFTGIIFGVILCALMLAFVAGFTDNDVQDIQEPVWEQDYECLEEIETGELINCRAEVVDSNYIRDVGKSCQEVLGKGWGVNHGISSYHNVWKETVIHCDKVEIICDHETICTKRHQVEVLEAGK